MIMSRKLDIGIICNYQPFPVKSGSNQRLAEMIRFLRGNNCSVHLVIIGAKYKNKELAKHVDSVHYFFDPRNRISLKLKSLYWRIGDWLTNIGLPHIDEIVLGIMSRIKKSAPLQVDYWKICASGIAELVKNIANSHHWDAVIVEYIWLYPSINMLSEKIVKFIDTHDVMHIRSMEIEKTGGKFPFKITESQEARILNYFNCVIAIQEIEKKIFCDIRTKYNMSFDIIKVGASVTLSRNSKKVIPAVNKERHSILFVGGYNELNIFGLKHFIAGIWIKLFDQYPSVQLTVCGQVCSAFRGQNYPGVNFLGYVTDLAEIYYNATIVVNPVWTGTGLKIKTIEAIVYGKPLVTTPSGIEGMDSEILDSCVVAENESIFLKKMIYLMDHPSERERLSIAAFEYNKRHFTLELIYREIRGYLDSIRSRKENIEIGPA
jgi:glycosyltransferase involved in cell wall biosynthesis